MPRKDNPRLVGDPVDTLTGAVVDRMPDFRLTGPIELRWVRHYDSSQAHRVLSAGRGSAHEYDRSLTRDAQGLMFEEPLRRKLRFPALQSDGDSCAMHGFRVERLSADRYLLSGHAEPAMEFVFSPGGDRARLYRLLKDGDEVRFHYEAGRLVGIDDSARRRLDAEEERDGRLLRLTLKPSGCGRERLLIQYRYDARGCLVATEDAKGRGYAMAYDNAGRMVQRRCFTGFAFDYRYDGRGRCVGAQGEGRLYGAELDYETPGRLTRVTRPDGGVWHYVFSDKGELDEIRDPLGGTQRFVRDENGRRTAEIDPNGNETLVERDDTGAAVAKIDPLGWRIPLPEDPSVAHPLDHWVADNPAEYEYGRAIDVRRIRVPGRSQTADLRLSPKLAGLVVFKPDEPSKETGDAPPARACEASPSGYPWWPAPETGRMFDDQGRLVEQRDVAGRRRRWRYDVAGNVREFVDFDGRRWTYDWGTWHFLLATTDPLGARVRYSYSPYGEVVSCADAGGTLSEYRYDLKDQLVEVRRHGVVRETYERDTAGNLTAKYASDGRLLLSQKIGPGNLPVQRVLGSGDVHDLKYDAAGRLIGGSTNKHRYEMAYDRMNNRTLELRDGLGVSMEFSDWGVPASQVFFGRFKFRWDREDDGTRVLTDPGGARHRLRIGEDGIVRKQFANGSSELAQYDELGRCLFKHAELGGGRDWTRRYHWSGEGELLRVEDSLNGTVEHSYDAAHRLVGRRIGGRMESYRLDAANNLLEQPGLQGVELMPGNRLAAANGERFTYNDRNHVAVREGAGRRIVYRYDSFDQLVAIDMPEGHWTAEYDILRRRVCKRWQGRETDFYWYGDQLAAEIAPDGRVRIYVYADPMALSPFMMLDYDSVEAGATECRWHYLFSDQLGTPSLIEDEERRVIWSAQIAIYGLVELTEKSGMECNLRWPGHYFDSETGFNYNRFRYYAPRIGRYLESDPLGIAGGVNLYGYVANPVVVVDVRGLSDRSPRSGSSGCGQPSSPLPYLPVTEGISTVNGSRPSSSNQRGRTGAAALEVSWAIWEKYIETVGIVDLGENLDLKIGGSGTQSGLPEVVKEYISRFVIIDRRKFAGALDMMAANLRELQNYVCIVSEPGKSNFWVTARVLLKVKALGGNPPARIISVPTKELGAFDYGISIPINLSGVTDIVFIDDAAYSGSQLANLISKVKANVTPNCNVNVHIGLVAASKAALEKISANNSKTFKVNGLYYSLQIQEFENSQKLDSKLKKLGIKVRDRTNPDETHWDGNFLTALYYKLPDYASVRRDMLLKCSGISSLQEPCYATFSNSFTLEVATRRSQYNFRSTSMPGRGGPHHFLSMGNRSSANQLALPARQPNAQVVSQTTGRGRSVTTAKPPALPARQPNAQVVSQTTGRGRSVIPANPHPSRAEHSRDEVSVKKGGNRERIKKDK